jgi:DNA-binding transcriptional LysR family regulator
MELRTIAYFVAVADAGSVSAATRLTHITQPSLSRQLRQLERELGLELFTRQDGRLTLTPAGRQFLPAARDLLSRAEATRAAAARIRGGSLPTITVAAPAVTLNDIVAPFFATFGPDDPMPRVLPLDASDEYGALDRGADLVIGTRPPSATFARTRVAALPVNAYVPAGHAMAGRTQVALAELAQFDLLVPTADSHARRALDAALENSGLAVRTLEFSSSQVVQAVAAAGRGVAVVSDDPRFGLVPLTIHTAAGDVLRIALHAAWQPHHHGAPQLAEVARRLKAFVGQRYRPEA